MNLGCQIENIVQPKPRTRLFVLRESANSRAARGGLGQEIDTLINRIRAMVPDMGPLDFIDRR